MLTRPQPSRPRPRPRPSKIGLETETGLEILTSHHKLIAEWTAKTKVGLSNE